MHEIKSWNYIEEVDIMKQKAKCIIMTFHLINLYFSSHYDLLRKYVFTQAQFSSSFFCSLTGRNGLLQL